MAEPPESPLLTLEISRTPREVVVGTRSRPTAGALDPEAARPHVAAVERGRKDFQRRRHPAVAALPCREGPAQHLGIELLHGARRPHHSERRVEGEKRLKQILLAPEAEIRLDELLRVIERRKYIVKMHEHAGR